MPKRGNKKKTDKRKSESKIFVDGNETISVNESNK